MNTDIVNKSKEVFDFLGNFIDLMKECPEPLTLISACSAYVDSAKILFNQGKMPENMYNHEMNSVLGLLHMAMYLVEKQYLKK